MVIFLNMDGTAEKVEPQHVYQGSNNVTSVTVVAPYAATTAMEIGFILPNGLYWTNEQGKRYMPMFSVEQDTVAGVNAWTYSLTASMTELIGELQIAINAVADGNTTSYLCEVQVEESVLPDVTNPPPGTDVYALLQLYVARLDGRTKNVPNLVWKIQKVAPNAITYTDNSGVESAPIVIEGGETAPMPLGAASVVKIPSTAWQPVESGQTVTGYKYIVTAGLHGQMRDGATANDLWVSFDEADSAAFRGAYEDYTVDTAGNITISVTQPIAMTVRVWNGKGLVDEAARADIAEETARAQSAESDLQAQIDHIEDSGYDRTAREMIAAETERAEAAEAQLQQNIDAEKMRAEAAAEQLQERLQEQIDDLETSKVDVSGGTMNDKLVVKGNNFPHVQVLNTVEGLSGYFEQSGGSLDIIARDAEGENLSYISLEDGIVRSHAALYENDQRVYSPNNPPPAGEVSSVNGQTGAVEITPENIGAVKIGGEYHGDLNSLLLNGTFIIAEDTSNRPETSPYGELLVAHNADTTFQLYVTYDRKEVWVRGGNNNGSNWKDWFQIANKEDVLPLSGGTMTDNLEIHRERYPAVTLIQTTTGDKALFENSGSSLDLILRDANNNNKSMVSVTEDGLVSNNVNNFLSVNNEFNFLGPACPYNDIFIGYRGAANETDRPQLYVFNGGRAQTDDQADILARRFYVGTWSNRQEVYSPNNPPIFMSSYIQPSSEAGGTTDLRGFAVGYYGFCVISANTRAFRISGGGSYYVLYLALSPKESYKQYVGSTTIAGGTSMSTLNGKGFIFYTRIS